MKYLYLFAILSTTNLLFAQETGSITGVITSEKKTISSVNISLNAKDFNTQTDSLGNYKLENIPTGNYKIQVSQVAFLTVFKNVLGDCFLIVFLIIKLPYKSSASYQPAVKSRAGLISINLLL